MTKFSRLIDFIIKWGIGIAPIVLLLQQIVFSLFAIQEIQLSSVDRGFISAYIGLTVGYWLSFINPELFEF